MVERFFCYRGFGIYLQPRCASGMRIDGGRGSTPLRCDVRIQKPDHLAFLGSFTLGDSGGRPFSNEFDAIVKSCYTVERYIDQYIGLSERDRPLTHAILAEGNEREQLESGMRSG
ncbi:hypothetical protein AAGS40_29855 (plasmid) [Paraburkholderia sp. PREW-6R]|uniref:hypothetical protein n=1 Tax=Paraburkholderia sp. PREW-6R TaxID=3141544 RepID=UPI0031F4DE54